VPYDSSVTRRKVFERDNYTCQLCGVKCLERFTLDDGVPDPVCPTVDHIIALSKRLRGHTWDNVQCACWQCNVDKGAAARGQLRLALV
jgi:5-methylcytosine-specific restriction endonuclease McrA